MKYLSLIVVAAFIGFTYWFSQRAEDLSAEQMNKMNAFITQYMRQAIEQDTPDAQDIQFSKVHTEVIESGRKMKAHFKFSYQIPGENGEPQKIYRKGTFVISSKDGDKWQAQIESANDVKVEFLEPTEITGSSEN